MEFQDLAFAGRAFRFSTGDGRDQVALGIANGTFEAPLPLILTGVFSRSGGEMADVGANTGLYSVLGAIARPSGRVHAFEPYPAIAEICRQNLAANGLSDRAIVHEVAVSDTRGKAELYIPDDAHGLIETSASLEKTWNNPKSAITVDRIVLDDLSLSNLSVIKVDIEGHEAAFLRGAEKTIASNRPTIFCEILPNADLEMMNGFIQRYSYLDFRLRRDLVILDRKVRHDPYAWNHAFVPVDRLGTLVGVCRSHNLEIAERSGLSR